MSASGNVARLAIAAMLLAAGAPCVPAQDKAGIDELKARAEAGERNATRQVAEAYYLGRDGVTQDFVEAARWYHRLAKQGDVRAQTTLGLMYARGYGVGKDLQAAHRWWSYAAAANDPGAQYSLGTLYLLGEGVQQDYARAARWYRQAAQRGHVQAQHDLGLLYYEGRGVEKDGRWAYYWVRVAALQGDDKAQETIKRVSAGMSAGEIREAEEQAQEWVKKAKKLLK
ncbi:MAG: sel1 repeat family protein [Burkholderiales bacterium]|nr:sel1 repeat family protein [Burkholderiales bacterium]